MKVIRSIPSRLRRFPIDGGGSDIQEGAVVMLGATAATNQGTLILADATAADAVGLLAKLHDFSAVGDAAPDVGTSWPLQEVIPFLPGCEVAAEYDQDTVLSVASATSTVITITSLADDMDGSWIYVVSGTGLGQLVFCTAGGSGTLTAKAAMTTTLDNTSKVIVISPQFYALHTPSSDRTKLISVLDPASATMAWVGLRNEYRAAGEEGWIELDPTKHSGINIGTTDVKIRAILSPRDTLFNPGS